MTHGTSRDRINGHVVHFEKTNFSGSETFRTLGREKGKNHLKNHAEYGSVGSGAIQIGEYSLQDKTARNAYNSTEHFHS